MKKLIFTSFFLLSFLSAVSFTEFSTTISAVEVADTETVDIEIEYNDMYFFAREGRKKELTLISYMGTDETVIVPETVYIPEINETYTVTQITDSALRGYGNNKGYAKYVTLPDAIDYFGSSVFENSDVVSVNIPQNLKVIPCNTFRRCQSLETVVFHDELIVAENAFEKTNIIIPDNVLVSKSTVISNSYSDIYTENDKPFVSDDFSFHFTTNQSTGVTYCHIDGYNGNSSDVVIPERILNNQVKSVNMSYSGTDKSEITSLTLPETDMEISIDSNSFSGSQISELNINSPCSLDKKSFADCKNLHTVVFNCNSVIDSETFSGCTSLNTVDFQDNVSIKSNAFKGCTALTSVNFMDKADLDRNAFMDCTALENISLDTSHNIIGNAFDSCTSLVNINNKPVFDSTTGEFIPEYSNFVKNSFYMAEEVGFINQYAEAQYKKIVAENINDSMNDIEKVKVLHDWVCEHTQYADTIVKPEYHTDASILLNDSTVCEGYAKACNLLFNYAGIETYYINSFDHAWNIVKIGNHYFHVDSTWDDGENVSYKYFLKSDSDIHDNGSHNDWTAYKPTSLHNFQQNQLPECNYSIGDTNMDGTINVADAVKMTGFLLGSMTETKENIVLYDMDYDGKTDVFDMIIMRQKLTE